MAKLRTRKTEEEYKKLIKNGYLEGNCKLCEGPFLKEFRYWRIIANDFPYDRIATTHHMITPKRHVPEAELSEQEMQEYAKLKNDCINQEYEFIIEPTYKLKSIPGHFHLHLIIAKD